MAEAQELGEAIAGVGAGEVVEGVFEEGGGGERVVGRAMGGEGDFVDVGAEVGVEVEVVAQELVAVARSVGPEVAGDAGCRARSRAG